METLNYALFDNPLTSDPTDFMAVVQNQDSIDLNRLVDDIVAEGTGLTRPQALAYNEKLFQLIEHYAGIGCRVNLPVASFRASIKGVFINKDDSFDPARHSVVIHVTPGPRIRAVERTVKTAKVKGASPMPDPQDFTDAATGEKNRTATPGGIAALKGFYLRFDTEDPDQGLFFVPAANAAAAVRVQQFTAIKPSELHFLVPQLAAGEYRLEVRATIRGGKNLRRGTLADIIEVA